MAYIKGLEEGEIVTAAFIYPSPRELRNGWTSIVLNGKACYVAAAEPITFGETGYVIVVASGWRVRDICAAIQEKKSQFGLKAAVGEVRGLELEVALAIESARRIFERMAEEIWKEAFKPALSGYHSLN